MYSTVISVQNALQRLEQLDGKLIQVEGVLEFERDGVALKVDSAPAQRPYIRLLDGRNQSALFRSLLGHLKHKRVQVIGLLRTVDGGPTAFDRRRTPRAGLDTLLILSL